MLHALRGERLSPTGKVPSVLAQLRIDFHLHPSLRYTVCLLADADPSPFVRRDHGDHATSQASDARNTATVASAARRAATLPSLDPLLETSDG